MSEDKKPKKDLRARLGRTIAPNTAGAAAPIAPPTGAIAPPTTAAGGGAAGGAPAGDAPVVAPPIVAPVAPPAALPFGAGIAPPPFAQPKPEPAKPKPPADPFAAGPAGGGPNEVRLVIDEKPVDDAEVGRRQTGRSAILVGAGLAVGLILGFGLESVNASNNIRNRAVRAADEIHASVNTAVDRLNAANVKLSQIATRASAAEPRVDYDTITQLAALEEPLDANDFTNKNYTLFPPETVGMLFQYYLRTQDLWAHFRRLRDLTAGETRRAELERTAAGATTRYGAALVTGLNGVVVARLGYLTDAPAAADGTPQPNKMRLLARRGTPNGTDLEPFNPQVRLSVPAAPTEPPAPNAPPPTITTHFVEIDVEGSTGVIGEARGAFATFRQELQETVALMEETIRIQGQLIRAVGEVASYEESFALDI